MTHNAAGVQQAGTHVFWLQPRVFGQQRVGRVAGGEHAQDVLHGKAAPSDDRLPAEDLRVDGDARQELAICSGIDDMLRDGPVSIERRSPSGARRVPPSPGTLAPLMHHRRQQCLGTAS
jgi:hypothetical protein